MLTNNAGSVSENLAAMFFVWEINPFVLLDEGCETSDILDFQKIANCEYFIFFLKIERRDDYGNSEKRYLLCQSSNIIESKYSELVFIYWANEKCYLTRLNIKLPGTFHKLPLNLCNACFLTKTIKIFWQEFNQKHFLLEVWLWVFILFSGSSTLVSRGFSQ